MSLGNSGKTKTVPASQVRAGIFVIFALLGSAVCAFASAQDLQFHVTYVCNGERLSSRITTCRT